MVRKPLVMVAIVAALLVAGCGDDDDGGDAPAPGTLKALIPPAEDLGPLEVERTFTWDNATDFVVQGLFIPEGTAPSAAIESVEDAGFESGAGQLLTPRGGGAPSFVIVAAFDSEDGAAEAQEYLHDQDLEQPCFAACSVSPEEMSLSDVPGATAVHYVPLKGDLPPGIFPFEDYAAEFTIGENLFYAHAGGDPGDIAPKLFERGMTAFYEHASSAESE